MRWVGDIPSELVREGKRDKAREGGRGRAHRVCLRCVKALLYLLRNKVVREGETTHTEKEWRMKQRKQI